MKKVLSIVLAALMVLSCCVIAFAEDTDKTLKFNEDGKFKIMQINDTQDKGKDVKKNMVKFIETALDVEKPDLVVFVGDQLSDVYPFASKEDYALAIRNILKPLEDRGIPFVATLGNHDHDRASIMPENEMYSLYESEMNYSTQNGPDSFTCSVPVLSSDGSKIAFNIYSMDSNNKAASGGYAGINAEQLAWYNETSAQLKAENGGNAVPSLLFQHVPVKEIYNLLKECDWNTPNAIYSRRDTTWYVLDETKATGTLGEAPCSEDFSTITGQYQAWLENGDIMGAFFAHDHVNNFEGITDDGIRMGYNGGTGFRSYGNGDLRSVRVFELDENDVTNYDTRLVTYHDIVGADNSTWLGDLLTPALLNPLMKVVYACFGWLIKLFK